MLAEYYVAMYSYSTEEPSDLAFGEGDMILVTHKDGDWWTGTLGDKSGIFPANYVKKVEIQVNNPFLLEIIKSCYVCKTMIKRGLSDFVRSRIDSVFLCGEGREKENALT